MIRHIVAETGFRDLRPLLTPALFDVLPLRKMVSEVRSVLGTSKDDPTRDVMKRHLEARDQGIRLAPKSPGRPLAPDLDDARGVGERILWLYFDQIFSQPRALVDMRAPSFVVADEVIWCPSSAMVEWDEVFIDALRDVYVGFYTDDDARFQDGMIRLRMEPATDIFRAHFGEEDQTNVRFESRALIQVLVRAFEACKDAGIEIHPNFLPFGVYLAGLYQSLEVLGARYDVQGAFQRAHADASRPHLAAVG